MEIAAAAAVVASVATGIASNVSANRQAHRAEAVRKDQERAIAEEKEQELQKRKTLIDQQRMQLGATGRATKGTSSAGVKASIPTTEETLG